MPRVSTRETGEHSGALIASPSIFGPQLLLHDSNALRPEVLPVRNDHKALGKPRGGFWTSSYHPDTDPLGFAGAWLIATMSPSIFIGLY